MVRVEIELDEPEYEDLIEIFEINKRYVSKRALSILGWSKIEIFLGDLLRYGVSAASEWAGKGRKASCSWRIA